MPRDGQGVFNPVINNWNPAVDGNEADPAGWNQLLGDISSAISQSVSSDGQTMMTGNANMGGYRIQSLGAPIGNGHALRRDQLIKGTNIASAATIDIPNEGALFEVTGTTAIEHITGAFDGRAVTLLFQDALTIKNGLDIVLPMGADIKTSAGLMLQFQRVENNKWSLIGYPKSRRLVTSIPAVDTGPIDMVGVGPMDWDADGEIYKALITTPDDLQWLGTPVGWLAESWDIAGSDVPPINDSRYRYIRLSAGDAYNAGVLTNETVSGSAPTITATGEISLAESPLNGISIHLINTSRPFLRPGVQGHIINSSNLAHNHGITIPTQTTPVSSLASGPEVARTFNNTNTSTTGGTEAAPRHLGVIYYLRIM